MVYNMHRLEKTLNLWEDRYDLKKYGRKQKKLRENFNIEEKVYVLEERIKKKSAPGKLGNLSIFWSNAKTYADKCPKNNTKNKSF